MGRAVTGSQAEVPEYISTAPLCCTRSSRIGVLRLCEEIQMSGILLQQWKSLRWSLSQDGDWFARRGGGHDTSTFAASETTPSPIFRRRNVASSGQLHSSPIHYDTCSDLDRLQYLTEETTSFRRP